jgi:hypothetical protein
MALQRNGRTNEFHGYSRLFLAQKSETKSRDDLLVHLRADHEHRTIAAA